MQIINFTMSFTKLMKPNYLELINVSNNCIHRGLKGTGDMYKHLETDV